MCIVFAITVFCVYLFYFIFYFHFLNYNIDEQIWAAFYIRTYDWWLNLLKLNTNCLNLIIITKHKVTITPPLKKNKKKTTNNIQSTKKNKQTNKQIEYYITCIIKYDINFNVIIWNLSGGENDGVGNMQVYPTACTFDKNTSSFYAHHKL